MKNKNNTPKRKRLKRTSRLALSKKWILSYTGKNIVKGYAKWYGVDLLCAIKELRINGVNVDEEYEKEVRQSMEAKKLARQTKEEKRINEREDEFTDTKFAFIAGYTSGGAAYGITHEEFGVFTRRKRSSYIFYTKDKSPEQTSTEIIRTLKLSHVE